MNKSPFIKTKTKLQVLQLVFELPVGWAAAVQVAQVGVGQLAVGAAPVEELLALEVGERAVGGERPLGPVALVEEAHGRLQPEPGARAALHAVAGEAARAAREHCEKARKQFSGRVLGRVFFSYWTFFGVCMSRNGTTNIN